MDMENDIDRVIININNLLKEYRNNTISEYNELKDIKNKYNNLLKEKKDMEKKYKLEIEYNKKIYIKKGEEKAKSHLSYRIGYILIRDSKSIFGFIKIPFHIIHEYKKWKNEKKNPKLSIIIPVYNSEKYIKQCLDSVLNQDFRDIEVICVDDGSTDNSLNILNDYAKKDKRVVIKRQNNKYAGVARNVGLSFARGEFVHFLDKHLILYQFQNLLIT